ncbi:MAG: hypothetical protein MJK13_08650 [Pseudomonadales bacterium]|nr:hypothetical protein [Pseudomonadales bacterium]
MAQVDLLKIGSSGFPTESDSATDDLTLSTFTAGTSFAVTGGVTITDNIVFNALDDTIAGVENQNLLDKEADETISGEYTFSDTLNIPTALDATTPVQGSVYTSGNSFFFHNGTSYIELASNAAASQLKKEMTSGEALTAGDAVYLSANDVVSKADASALATGKFIGFAETTVGSAVAVNVITAGIAMGVLTAATVNDHFFLSETSGDVTSTRPSTSGAIVYFVGYASNATDICVQNQFIAVVA